MIRLDATVSGKGAVCMCMGNLVGDRWSKLPNLAVAVFCYLDIVEFIPGFIFTLHHAHESLDGIK